MSSELLLPDHVIYNILLCLPVQILLRFRSLSKQWNHTITSQSFARNQFLKRSDNTCTNLIRYVLLLSGPSTGYSYHCGITSNTDLRPDGRVSNVKVDMPFKKLITDETSEVWFRVSSSCHGLVCLIYHFKGIAVLFVWNPLTNNYREFLWPEEFVTEEVARLAFVGFGYDHIIQDYKIVVCTRKMQTVRTYVMTLNTNKWRNVDASSWQHYMKGCFDSSPVFINGTVFWLSTDNRNRSQVLLKFNIVEERLTTLVMSARNNRDENDYQRSITTTYGKLGVYEDSVCYHYYTTGTDMVRVLLTWRLEETEDGESWFQFVNISQLLKVEAESKQYYVPVGFTDDNKLVMTFSDGRELAVYRQNENKLVKLKLSERVDHEVNVHFLDMESLICP